MQTVESIATMHTNALARVGRHQRKIEWLTGQLARPGSIYVLMALITAWIAFNAALAATAHHVLDPPPFAGLEAAVSVGALLVTTMILVAQNRLNKHAEQRAQLDLQVNLLVDAKVTKLIGMLEDLRRDMPSVPNRRDSVVEEMKATVDPSQVLSALEKTIEDKQSEGRRTG
jgi:uncharacterized membrane protein